MGLVSQDDWGGGIFRGRRAPPNAFYDLVGLLNDEGQPFRRGGSAYKSTGNAATSLLGLAAAQTAAGPRVVMWGNTSDLYVLDGSDAPLTIPKSAFGDDSAAHLPFGRAVQVGPFMLIPKVSTSSQVTVYAGSRKAEYSTGTVSTTAASRTVTGAGTSWLANVDAGMIFSSSIGGTDVAIVESVQSDTSLTLRDPFTGATAATPSYLLSPRKAIDITVKPEQLKAGQRYLATAGLRLLVAANNRIQFNQAFPAVHWEGAGSPTILSVNDGLYHELPQDSQIIGAVGMQDVAVIFTTTGVWTISNMAFDALDDVGNVQHEVRNASKDLILWGDAGVAGFANQLLVPAIDDVYVFALGSTPLPITGGMDARVAGDTRALYRSYVKAGYQPGTAAVHRGHYFLPILNGTTLVDVLVSRLDRGFACSRWAGHAAGGAYAQQVGEATRSPKLLGVSGQRVTDLTGCMDPVAANKLDADGATPAFSLVTRDYDLGPAIRKHTATKLRLECELVEAAGGDNPTITAEIVADAAEAGASYTTLSGSAPETTTASQPKTWNLVKKCERLRVRLTAVGASASLIVKRLEIFTRDAGR